MIVPARVGYQAENVRLSPVFEEIRLNGTVNAMRASRLSATVAGLVESVAVNIGDIVDAGDTLIVLDDEQARP